MFSGAIITGSIAFDEIMDFPGSFGDYIMPDKIHKLNVSFVVDTLEKQIGGTGTNIAYSINLFEKNKVLLASAIGSDGQIFIDWMNTQGMSTKLIYIDRKLFTATGKAITDKDDNQIWGFYYGACISGKNIDLSKKLNKTTLLVISANHPDAFLNFQSQAIKQRIEYIYDPGMSLTWIKKDDLREGVLNSRWFVGNDYEVERISEIIGFSASQLADKGIHVITTLGHKGVRYQHKDEHVYLPAVHGIKIVDPTGAGDAWRGGFIAGLLRNMSIKESLAMGNAVASFAVERYGTVNHKPTLIQVKRRMREILRG